MAPNVPVPKIVKNVVEMMFAKFCIVFNLVSTNLLR
jgi:hypothetical protein